MKQTTGEFLATLRKASGYTQQDVAEKLGVSNRTLSSWETDRTAPDLLILPAIADLYGVTVDEILRGERRSGAENTEELSDGAKRNLRKRRFAKYGVRRLICFGLGLLGGAVFVAACAILLYSSAQIWLPILLMVVGAGGCAACVILLACFTYSAVRGEGIVLKEDYNEDNKPYVLTLRHNTANALILLSLPYILGVIVFLIVFYAAGYYNYSVSVGDVTVEIDYTTPTVTLVCLNTVFAVALFISGLTYNITGVKNLGSETQLAAFKSNCKLLGKICCFGLIPVYIAAILLGVFCSVKPCGTSVWYFEADSVEGVYKEFQTLTTLDIVETDTDGTVNVIVPAGEYYLNFQSDSTVVLHDGFYGYPYSSVTFYDLGNGFYGRKIYENGWNVYRVIQGKNIADAKEDEDYFDYLSYVNGSYNTIHFPSSDGATLYAVNVYYSWLNGSIVEYEQEGLISVEIYRGVRRDKKTGVYRYERYSYYDLGWVFTVVFFAVTGAAVIADTAAYFIKRKRTEYSF